MAFSLLGCNGENSSNSDNSARNAELLILINNHKEIWENSNLESYMFTYYAAPSDCPYADPFPPVVISVEASEVTSVFVPDFGTYIDVGDRPTIDDIFTAMIDALSSNPMIYSESPAKPNSLPLFDSQHGFPIVYSIDHSDSPCDGTTYSINEFQ